MSLGSPIASSPLKVAPPQLAQCYPRPRLYQALDDARQRSVVWVSAPAGAGKTTLVASYVQQRGLPAIWYAVDERDNDVASFFSTFRSAVELVQPGKGAALPQMAPEHGMALGIFARHYCEQLYGALRPPVVLVLDDLHELADASPWWTVLRDGLCALPPGLTLIGVSRRDVPAALARRRAGGELGVIGWPELQLQPDETVEMARALSDDWARDQDAAPGLHAATGGWAAGVVLTLEWMRVTGGRPGAAALGAPSSVFDYFASEVLDKLPSETRDFLMQTALLPVLTPALTAELTGQPDSARTLEQLNRHNYFTQRRGASEAAAYQYHPLFRTFLLQHGRQELAAGAREALASRAVRLIEEHGHLEEALGLSVETGRWDAAKALLRRQVSELVDQSRHQILERWLAAFPAEHEDGWLLYWRALARRLTDPPDATALLERAAERFRATGDAEGCFLTWAEWVESCIYAGVDLRPLYRAMSDLAGLERRLGPPPPEVAQRVAISTLAALLWRDPGHPAAGPAAASVHRSLPTIASQQRRSNVAMSLWMYHFMRGEPVQAELIADQPVGDDAGPLALMLTEILRACSAWLRVDLETAEAHLRAGLEEGERSGLTFWTPMLTTNLALCAALRGDTAAAGRHLAAVEALLPGTTPFQETYYLAIGAWVAMDAGRLDEAWRLVSRWQLLSEGMGEVLHRAFRLTLSANVSFERGDLDQAEASLAQAFEVIERQGCGMHELAAHLTRAHFRLEQGRDHEARAALERGLRFGRERGLFCAAFWRRGVIARLCARALEWDIEPAYATTLVRKHRLPAPAGLVRREAWPWAYEICTLGGFAVLRDGAPLSFGRKAPRRPLELLKLLVTLGGRGVPADQICDALWPEAEGDAASQAFQTRLHRLRAALGDPALLVLEDGRLSLDASRCWVDLWQLEDLYSHPSGDVADQLLELYGGDLLAGEDHAWCLPARERLARRFVQLVVEVGGALEGDARWSAARRLYERSLDAATAAEPLFQGLMRCQLAQGDGDPVGATRTFALCEQRLREQGLTPSGASRELLQRAQELLS